MQRIANKNAAVNLDFCGLFFWIFLFVLCHTFYMWHWPICKKFVFELI